MSKILLYTCCAPCCLPILEYFQKEGDILDISLYFFNSNIYMKEEYDKRLEYVRKISDIYNVSLLEGKYNHLEWMEFLKSNLDQELDKYQENDKRCLMCFDYRLENAIKFAIDNGFDSFCSTLQTNLYKDTEYIINRSKSLCEEYGLKFININLDKKTAYELGKELCKKYDIYRQRFCGCEFSINNK